MTYEELVEQVRELPVSQRKQLINDLVDSLIDAKPQLTKRIPGLNAGSTVFISDDFDAELPGSFWLGYDE